MKNSMKSIFTINPAITENVKAQDKLSITIVGVSLDRGVRLELYVYWGTWWAPLRLPLYSRAFK